MPFRCFAGAASPLKENLLLCRVTTFNDLVFARMIQMLRDEIPLSFYQADRRFAETISNTKPKHIHHAKYGRPSRLSRQSVLGPTCHISLQKINLSAENPPAWEADALPATVFQIPDSTRCCSESTGYIRMRCLIVGQSAPVREHLCN